MTVRDTLIAALRAWADRHDGEIAPEVPEQMADAYRAEVLAEADPWPVIDRLVAWLDQNNGRSHTEITLRLLKISEEAGEVAQAWIGYTGQNPRKGVTHSAGDVADELCDVIVTAMVALYCVTDFPARHFAGKLAEIAAKRGAGKDTLGGGQPPAGESTQPGPDLHSLVHTALADLARLLPRHTVRLFTDRVVDAVAPLVPYRRVWDPALPPGGYVCNICGEPVESEPCPQHGPEDTEAAPGFFQPGRTYTRRDGTTFQCFTVTTTPWNGQPLAVGWHTDLADITSISWRGVDEWRHEYDGCQPPAEDGGQ